jgi:toxin secretion/phage lysis holin
MCAILDRKISSDIGGKGIFRKVVIFSLVALGNIIDINILGKVGVIRTAVIFFYISNEGISILENATRLGLPIPEKLRNVLQQLNEGGDKDGN